MEPGDEEEFAEEAISKEISYFLNRYSEIIGEDEVSALVESARDLRESKFIRVENLLNKKSSGIDIVKILGEEDVELHKLPLAEYGYRYTSQISLGAHLAYLSGKITLQEYASQLPAQILSPPEGAIVLDVCAAPGMKTTQLASMVGPSGKVVAVDDHAHRLGSLQTHIERLELSNVVIVRKDARYIQDLGLTFDYIICDVPCSGNMAGEEDWEELRTMHDPKSRSTLQLDILRAAIQCLAPNGHLIYSTCSLEFEENEAVVSEMLQERNDIDLADTGLGVPGVASIQDMTYDPRVERCARLWPHKTGSQGFFIAHFIAHPTKEVDSHLRSSRDVI